MVDKRYYEKLGGFSYLFGELRRKLGQQQTDALVADAVTLCNELCEKYKGLPKKEKLHTEQMIFPRAAICDLPADAPIHPAGGSHDPAGRGSKDRRGA